MAEEKISTAGLKVEHMHWGAVVSGTREQFIAAGLALAGEFPGDPGRNRYTQTLEQGRRLERRGKRFCMYLNATHALAGGVWSEEAWEAAARAEREAHAAERRQAALQSIIDNPEGPRELSAQYFEAGIGVLAAAFNLEERPGLPYTFPAAVREAAAERLRELGEIFRAQAPRVRREALAAGDAGFQKFMARARGSSGL